MPLFTLLPVFGYALFAYLKCKRNISTSIFFSITFILSVLYLMGLFNLLKVGAFLLFYAGCGIFVYLAYKNSLQVFKIIGSVPVVVFTVASVIYWYLFQDAHYFFWDEFSHWGVYVKEMMYTHKLYGAESIAGHLRYPPGSAVWQYFVSVNTEYSEATTYFAHFLLLLGSTLPLYEKISFRQPHWIVLILALQILFFANLGHGFSSIYVDHVVGAVFLGILLCFVSQEYNAKTLAGFVFPLTTLVLIKEIGLFFVVAAVGFMGVLFLTKYWKAEQSFSKLFREQRYLLLALITLVTLSFLVHSSWNWRQDLLDVPKEAQTISGIVKVWFTGESVLTPETEKVVKQRFWEVFLNQQISKSEISQRYNEFSYNIMSRYTDSLRLSTAGFLFVFLVISFIAFALYNTHQMRIRTVVSAGYVFIITLIYIAIVYFSYLVAFGEDALRIPSYVRYINTALLPLMFCSGVFFLPVFVPVQVDSTPGKKKDRIQNFSQVSKMFFCFITFNII